MIRIGGVSGCMSVIEFSDYAVHYRQIVFDHDQVLIDALKLVRLLQNLYKQTLFIVGSLLQPTPVQLPGCAPDVVHSW